MKHLATPIPSRHARHFVNLSCARANLATLSIPTLISARGFRHPPPPPHTLVRVQFPAAAARARCSSSREQNRGEKSTPRQHFNPREREPSTYAYTDTTAAAAAGLCEVALKWPRPAQNCVSVAAGAKHLPTHTWHPMLARLIP